MDFANSWSPPSTLSFSPSVKFVNNNAYNLGGRSWSCFRFYNIPEGITNGALMFESCSDLNHNVKLPSTLQNACNLFTHCYNLNQKNYPSTILFLRKPLDVIQPFYGEKVSNHEVSDEKHHIHSLIQYHHNIYHMNIYQHQ